MTAVSVDIHQDRILILDFGSQYTQLIARRVRELGVYCEILSSDLDEASFDAFSPNGVILSGGPESVTKADTPRAPEFIFAKGKPVLGICYGMQTMAEQLGGRVESVAKHEFGHADIAFEETPTIFSSFVDDEGAPLSSLDVWMSHGDQVVELPHGFVAVASTSTCPIAAMARPDQHFYGVQFHPEVHHTPRGAEILDAFLKEVCGCAGLWTPDHIVEDIVARVREQVGEGRVILGLSGGVDSSVVAALLARAIGDQLSCVFVDNGLLRFEEANQVMNMMTHASNNALDIRVIQVDASDTFLTRLEGVADPEAKRKVIGNTFIEVFDAEADKIEGARFLAQGTIYPDLIESGGLAGGKAHVIKSHHNVGGLPEDMKLELVEPLRELFKDEVRKIGLALGLPSEMVFRHPFPGPGLGVRILGEVKREYADILRRADAIYIEELRAANLYDVVSQAFTVFLPVKSVGVVGDARRYEYVVALRAVETIDFMTARAARLPYDFLEKVSSRIINEIKEISRVTLDISSKPPATIEWE